MTGTKIITMLGALLALVLVGGSQTDANAQGRGQPPTTAELSCATIRNAHIREVRAAGRAAGDLAHQRCGRGLRVCRADAIGAYGLEGCGSRRSANAECQDAYTGCWETYRRCDTYTAIKQAKHAAMAQVLHDGCASLIDNGCPLKKKGRRDEPKFCPSVAAIVGDADGDDIYSLFD